MLHKLLEAYYPKQNSQNNTRLTNIVRRISENKFDSLIKSIISLSKENKSKKFNFDKIAMINSLLIEFIITDSQSDQNLLDQFKDQKNTKAENMQKLAVQTIKSNMMQNNIFKSEFYK